MMKSSTQVPQQQQQNNEWQVIRVYLKIHVKKNSKLYDYINEVRGGWNDIIYIIIEEIECKSLRELENIEYKYIKLHINDSNCLNKMLSVQQKYIIDRFKKKYKN